MSKRRALDLTPALLLALAAAVIAFFLGRATAPGGRGAPDPTKVEPAAGAGAAGEGYVEAPIDLPPSPFKGGKDATVVIHEVSDFQCPFCSKASDTVAQVAETYGDQVKVVFVHQPLAFHKDARLAAIASMAAARQGHFWKYHDQLFANQKALGKDELLKYAEGLGMDMAKFKADLDDPKLALKVEADQAAATALGATGTPAFFINGVKLSGAKPLEEFKAEIDKQLAKAKELTDKGTPAAGVARALTAGVATDGPKVVKYLFDGQAAPKVAKTETPAQKPVDTKTVYKVTVDPADPHEHMKGAKDAQVTIVEWSDFECPFCSKALPEVKKVFEAYPDKVRFVFKHNPLPFHKSAPLASAASLAAGEQGKFWEYHDLLFGDQKKLARDDLLAGAKTLGLDEAKFVAAMDKGYPEKITRDQDLAQGVGASGTPALYVNGRKAPSFQMTDLKPLIDEEITKTDKLLAEGVSREELYGKLIANGKVTLVFEPVAQPIPLDGMPMKGAKDAPITIVEFADFQCPPCSRARGALSELVAKYPDQIRVGFKHFPLDFHKQAQKASEAAVAAQEQGHFWEFHDLLFDNQKALEVANILTYAQQIGLDAERLKAEVESGKHASKVKADMAIGNQVGVRGTPSLFVNGRKYSGNFQAADAIERALAKEFGLKLKSTGLPLHD
jgi:protein-disulfide isomerase